MGWNNKQVNQHKQAAKLLSSIIYEVVEYIKDNPQTTDVEVRQFIAQRYKKYHLKSDRQKSIVAFGDNTANVHFYAEEPRKLKKGNLIMVDIWARLAENGAPFADITWMMYYGRKPPKQYADAFRLAARARDKAIKYLQSSLKNKIAPIGKEIDVVVRNYLAKHGQSEKFLHGTGHSLGLTSPHGRGVRINRKGRLPLPLNIGYTIEPGLYFKNKFGIRSEIDFYINENYKIIITAKLQKNIIKI